MVTPSEKSTQHTASNEHVTGLLKFLFKRVLAGLNIARKYGQYDPPSSFIIYAHDDKNDPANGDAGEQFVSQLIECFKLAGSRVRSDKLPVLHLTSTTAADREARRDILLNQFCLLPKKISRNPVDIVILIASKVLFGYCNDTHGKRYMEALRQTMTFPDLKKDEADGKIRKVVDEYINKAGFHHVLTEIAMVAARIEMDANPLSIVPIMHQDAKLEDLRKILPNIPNTSHYHRPRKSDRMLDPDAQSLHRLFFNVLIKDVCSQHDEQRKSLYATLYDLYETGVKTLEDLHETGSLHSDEFKRIVTCEVFEEILRESMQLPLDMKNRSSGSAPKAKQGAAVELHDLPSVTVPFRPFAPHPEPTTQLSNWQREYYLKWRIFPKMNLHAPEPMSKANESLDWVIEHPSYQKWIQERSSMLGVFGKPGSGKSTVLRSIVSTSQDELKTRNQPDQLFLRFFFKRRGPFKERSRIGMFSALFHQVLVEVPMADHEFWLWMEEEATSAQREKIFREKIFPKEVDHLRSWFLSSLITASSFHRIVIVVDAIDEADDGGETETARDVLADLRFINKRIRRIENADVRICFSSRYQPTIAVDNGYEIRVDECNQDAIRAYVTTEIAKNMRIDPTDNEYRETLIQKVVEASEGIFSPVILPGRRFSSRLISSRHKFMPVPKFHLSEEYRRIIRNHRDSDEFIILVDWITSAFRPLSLEEIRHAIACDDKYTVPVPEGSQSSCGFYKDDLDFSRRIRHLFCGLVEVREDNGVPVVRFIHRTVLEFFRNIEQLDTASSESDCQNRQLARSHHRLGLSCLNFIRIESSRWEGLTPNELESIPFCRYAVEHWLKHAKMADRFGVQPGELARLLSPLLDDGDKQVFLHWVKAYKTFHPDTLSTEPNERDVADYFRISLPKNIPVDTESEVESRGATLSEEKPGTELLPTEQAE